MTSEVGDRTVMGRGFAQLSFQRRKRRAGRALDMTPLIDIVFQLIAFFVFATGFQSMNTEIRPPASPGVPTADNATAFLLIEVDRTGEIRVQQQVVEEDQLVSEFKSRIATMPSFVVIRADGKTVYAEVQRVMEALKELKVTNVKLQTRGET